MKPFLFLLLCQDLEWCRYSVVFELGEELLSLRVLEHLLRWHSDYIDDELKLLLLVCSWEERKSCEKFDYDATKAPHVNLLGIGKEPKNDVWSPIEPTLDVGVYNLIL